MPSESAIPSPSDVTSLRESSVGVTSARASIAEALFEILDEIHQQPVVLSSRPSVSSIGSAPTPNEVVESLSVKLYTKSQNHQIEDAAQPQSSKKESTAGHVFDKGYLRIGAIKMDEKSSTNQNPNGLCADADSELREISEKLHKRVKERIDGGSEGSIASSETVLEIFGKSRLGILHHKISKGQSSSKQTKASLEKQLAASQAHIVANEAHIKELQSRMTVFEAYMRKGGKMSMTPSMSVSEDTLEDEEDM